MKYAWLVIGIFAARCFTTAIAFPPGDGDLWWQRLLGQQILRDHAVPRTLGSEAFTAPYAPWVPQEWLFGIAAYLGRSGIAWDVFAAACACAAIAALAIACAQAVRRGASPVAIAVCSLFASISLFESFGVRAQVVAWPMLALFLFLLDVDGPWCFAAVAVAAIWSNWHASAMLAPVLAAASAVGSAIDERGVGARTRRLAIVTALSAVAICINPFGWDLPHYALGLFNNPIKSYITEWQVTSLTDLSFTFGSLPLMLIAMALGTREGAGGEPNDHRARDLCLLAAFGFLMLSAGRNINIFAIVALPIVASALTRRIAWFARPAEVAPNRLDRIAAYALPAVALLLALGVSWQLAKKIPPATGLANAPLAALAKMPGDHDILCTDFAWCSLALGVPHERVFLDGRADPYPRAVWDDFVSVLRLDRDWNGMLDRRHVNAIVVARDGQVDQALALVGGWHVAYADKDYRVWLRSGLGARQARLEPVERRVTGT
jgi:hypothetical protein